MTPQKTTLAPRPVDSAIALRLPVTAKVLPPYKVHAEKGEHIRENLPEIASKLYQASLEDKPALVEWQTPSLAKSGIDRITCAVFPRRDIQLPESLARMQKTITWELIVPYYLKRGIPEEEVAQFAEFFLPFTVPLEGTPSDEENPLRVYKETLFNIIESGLERISKEELRAQLGPFRRQYLQALDDSPGLKERFYRRLNRLKGGTQQGRDEATYLNLSALRRYAEEITPRERYTFTAWQGKIPIYTVSLSFPTKTPPMSKDLTPEAWQRVYEEFQERRGPTDRFMEAGRYAGEGATLPPIIQEGTTFALIRRLVEEANHQQLITLVALTMLRHVNGSVSKEDQNIAKTHFTVLARLLGLPKTHIIEGIPKTDLSPTGQLHYGGMDEFTAHAAWK